jgi:homoserine kinase type II
LLHGLEQQYAFGPIRAYRDLGGAYNLNVRVETLHGSYVARVYRPWVTAHRLRALHTIKRWLHAQQLPILLPLPTVAGETLTTYEDRLVEVEPFLPHNDATEVWSRYAQAFALLGRFHTVLAGYAPAATLPPPLVENYALPTILAQWVEHAKHRIQQLSHAQATAAVALCKTTLALLEQLALWWTEAGDRLPRQLVHGDYGVGNLLWRDHQIMAIGDFDFLAVHERVFDVAYPLYWMCRRLEPTTDPQGWAWDQVAAMMGQYNMNSQPPLTSDERRAVPFEMARVPLYWIGEAGFLDDPISAVLSHTEGVAAAQWLIEHAHELKLG